MSMANCFTLKYWLKWEVFPRNQDFHNNELRQVIVLARNNDKRGHYRSTKCLLFGRWNTPTRWTVWKAHCLLGGTGVVMDRWLRECNHLGETEAFLSRAHHNVLFILSVIHRPTSWLASRQLARSGLEKTRVKLILPSPAGKTWV